MAAFEVIALDTATPQLRAPGASDTYTFPRAVEMPLGTANGVLYLDGSKVVTSGSALTYNGSTLATTGALTVDGNVTLGNASTDTVQVNGYMGVGGAGASTVGVNVVNSALTGNTQYGVAATPVGTGTTQINGVAAAAGTANSAFTVANASGFRALNLAKGAASTITSYHGLYIEDLTQGTNNYGITSLVSSGSNKWNIYASGTAANYFAGNVGIGTSSPTAVLDVRGSAYVIGAGGTRTTDTANGNGFEVIPSTTNNILSYNRTSNTYLPIRWRALDQTFEVDNVNKFKLSSTETVFNETGADTDFRVESNTNTHALFVQGSDGNVGIGTGSPAYKFHLRGFTDSLPAASGTNQTGVGLRIQPENTSGILDIGLSAGVAAWLQSTNSGNLATNYALALNPNGGNVSVGGTAARATTAGSKALNIFDGTAPVGTLTNGISIYSSSGEAYVMDAAGNATLFSPHDAETNEWIFKSKHTPTGKVLRIDVEKLLRFVNDHFGLDAVQEFIES